MDTARRGNYESGSDYVLEYGELRFTFNERDFTERVEQAAGKEGGGMPEFLSTHPADETRIRNIEKWLPEALGYYEDSALRR